MFNIADIHLMSNDTGTREEIFIKSHTSNKTNVLNSNFFELNQTTIDWLRRIIINSHSMTENLFNESEHENAVNVTKSSLFSWQKTCFVAFFTTLIFITIFGNTLVILSVITTRRLRTVTNCFVMSLAIADWMVGTMVMPPAVLLYIHGKRNRFI